MFVFPTVTLACFTLKTKGPFLTNSLYAAQFKEQGDLLIISLSFGFDS